MASIRDFLPSFDIKERAWLVRNAIGSMSPLLSGQFLSRISEALTISPPLEREQVWWGIDYHLDWLAAAMHTFHVSSMFSESASMWPETNEGMIAGTVEDVDLIVADTDRVILIEAKAFGEWDLNQLRSKLNKLDRLVGRCRRHIVDLEQHRGRDQWTDWALARSGPNTILDPQFMYNYDIFLMLISPNRPPTRSECLDWPSWALKEGLPYWMPMETSHDGAVRTVTRTNSVGETCSIGPYYKINFRKTRDKRGPN